MSVYVDDGAIPYGRMKMCHMVADSTEELLAMADRIGVQRRWIQSRGTYREHFDISQTKRALAVEAGAIELSKRELVSFIQGRRGGEPTETKIIDLMQALKESLAKESTK